MIALTFTQTKIMEMGQPPAVQGAHPAMWVRSRQFTGRIVTVTNDKVFDGPVYNYTREFPFIWQEMTVPIPCRADHARAEAIPVGVRGARGRATGPPARAVRRALERRYFINLDDLTPRVFWHLTDNRIELTVRFLVRDHEMRDVKDAVARAAVKKFQDASIEVASATYEIAALPPLLVRTEPAP